MRFTDVYLNGHVYDSSFILLRMACVNCVEFYEDAQVFRCGLFKQGIVTRLGIELCHDFED